MEVLWDDSEETCHADFQVVQADGTVASTQEKCEELCAEEPACKFYFQNTSNGWCGGYQECTTRRSTPTNAGKTYEYVCGIFYLSYIKM